MISNSRKIGFVISPIGKEGSSTRERSDHIFQHIIAPALADCGYSSIRGDKIDKPGAITEQILDLIWNADIVIAGLTDYNPNVFYELGVRSAAKKPVISLINSDQTLPFDAHNNRTIFIDHSDSKAQSAARAAIIRQIAAIEDSQFPRNSPDTLSKSHLPRYLKELEAAARGRSREATGSTAEGFHARIYIADTPEKPLGVIFAQSPPDTNRYIFLTPVTMHVTFGRGPDFRTFIGTNDELMSKYHFVMEVNPMEVSESKRTSFEVVVKDLASKHGIRVNGRRVEAANLAHGDLIEAGLSKFTLFLF